MRCATSSLLNHRQIHAGHHLRFSSPRSTYLYAAPRFHLLAHSGFGLWSQETNHAKNKNTPIKIDGNEIAHNTLIKWRSAQQSHLPNATEQQPIDDDYATTTASTRCAAEHGKAFYLFLFIFMTCSFSSVGLLYAIHQIYFTVASTAKTMNCILTYLVIIVRPQ